MSETYVTYAPQRVIQRAEMIAWVETLGAITAEALAVREELSTDVARERLDEAVELGFLDRHSVLVGYSDLYVARTAGRRFSRKHADAGGYAYPDGLRTARVTIKEARHLIACASVAAALERRYPDHRIISERELHRDESKRGRRLASVNVRRRGETQSHFPDVVIWPPAPHGEPPPLPIAVEVELTAKWKEDLTTICRGWARGRHLGGVLYYAETPKIEEKLLDVVEALQAEETIVVNPLSSIVDSLPGFQLSPLESETEGDR
jgi:hypothetical protein